MQPMLDTSHLPPVPEWHKAGEFTDIVYEKCSDGIAKITINRPQVHNAFRPQTVMEMSRALNDARNDAYVGVIILTGMGEKAFCSGGDQKVRGTGGYVGDDGTPRLNVLDLQREIRTCPKPVVAMVAGWCVGGGHVLHMMCDLTIAAENAMFGQTGPRVGSFDGGWGASYMARIVGQKKAREIWFLCRFYNAKEALDMVSSTRSFRLRSLKPKPSSGAARCLPTPRSPSAASRPPSTPTATARRACRSSRATPRSSTI